MTTDTNSRAMTYDVRSWYSAIVQRTSNIAPRIWLLLLVLSGVALRLWLISFTPLNPSFSTADDGDYYQRAFRFAVTGQFVDDGWLIRPPLHVLFFALWLRLAVLLGHPQLGVPLVQLAQTAIGALSILLGYGVARRLFASTLAGLLFAAVLALWFPFVEQPSVFFSELLYLFLFLLHYWLLLRFDASGRWQDLALSGLALGAAALTRSPALYSLAFVVLWLLMRPTTNDQRPTTTSGESDTQHATRNTQHAIRNTQHAIRFSVLGSALLVVACCLVVVLPWTIRNYVVYQRIIPIDTLGQINLWLDLGPVSQRNAHIAELRGMPQADRQAYALAHVREILAADPLRPFRAMWPTFLHIWKAQYVEDLFIKQSFFTRPLRETAALGLFGDLLWFVFTLAGLVGLVAPPREGLHNRLFALAWLSYSLLTVLVFHVEPRYLVPIWTLLGLYGAGTLARIRPPTTDHRPPMKDRVGRWSSVVGRWSVIAQWMVAIAFIALVVTYRNYPSIIATGLARERAMAAGERAYAAGDYAAAERSFRAALAAQPDFVDAQAGLALALAAQGRRDEAAAAVASGGSRRADLVSGMLALRAGAADAAQPKITRIEASAGESAQAWALEWLRPPATTSLHLGDQHDIGYISGFSRPEEDTTGSFRWLGETGQLVLPLPAPASADTTVALRLSGGRPGTTPLEARIGDGPTWHLPVAGGQWRVYHLPIPPSLVGQTRLAIKLRAPPFIPAFIDPASQDLRVLSVRVSDVWVE